MNDNIDEATRAKWRSNPRSAWKEKAIEEHKAYAAAAAAGKLPKNPDHGGTFTRGEDGELTEVAAE